MLELTFAERIAVSVAGLQPFPSNRAIRSTKRSLAAVLKLRFVACCPGTPPTTTLDFAMGMHNTLHTEFQCTRCKADVHAEVECHFGYAAESQTLKMGDRYPWRIRRQPQNGGRPEGGNTDGDSYFHCPKCDKDAHVFVVVRDDVIVGVKLNPAKEPYIPD